MRVTRRARVYSLKLTLTIAGDGRKTQDGVCRYSGFDCRAFLAVFEEYDADLAAMSLTELADHIEQTHHAYLHSELPRLDEMTEKVVSVHGERNSRLHQIREIFLALAAEMSSHMMKEERILFPMVRELDTSETTPAFHCGSLANPIRQMESEHTQAEAALEKLRELTDDYTPSDWACNNYRAMLDALAHFEHDLHLHIHKESSSLFPRALEMENKKGS